MSPDDTGRSDRSREFLDDEGRTLPERIRQRRTAQRLLSRELAEALAVSPAYVAMIEHGKKVPSEEIAVAIAGLLDDDPELYRAWVHSTRFSDPQSTLRGLQRLHYSPAPSRSRMLPASQRAARRRQDPLLPSSREELEADASEARQLAHTGDVVERRLSRDPVSSPQIPLIALGAIRGSQVRFWRLPWAFLDHDPRSRRFVVAAAADRDTLLVATPEQFVDIVMNDEGTDLMKSEDWCGWPDRLEPEADGGAHAQPLVPQGRLAPLLIDRGPFLERLGDRVDVIVRVGSSYSIQRLTLPEFADLLTRPTM